VKITLRVQNAAQLCNAHHNVELLLMTITMAKSFLILKKIKKLRKKSRKKK